MGWWRGGEKVEGDSGGVRGVIWKLKGGEGVMW